MVMDFRGFSAFEPASSLDSLPRWRVRASVRLRMGTARKLDSALAWLRRRQRTLARAVLALFCLAWLQAAVVPCAMAGAAAATMPAGGQHCPYCPQGASVPSTSDHGGGCAYPHGPQVDSNAAAALFIAIPTPSFTPAPDTAARDLHAPATALPGPVPRLAIPLIFCRLIE